MLILLFANHIIDGPLDKYETVLSLYFFRPIKYNVLQLAEGGLSKHHLSSYY